MTNFVAFYFVDGDTAAAFSHAYAKIIENPSRMM